MQNNARESTSQRVVILGTGGTIAGTAASASQQTGYTSAQIGVGDLVAAIPSLAGEPLEVEQVAQIDSKDMDFDVWVRLAQRVAHHAARDDVTGIVITHGTDTLEETAYFLQRVLAPAKPVVLTGAMRPATAVLADGPQNLIDAVAVARAPSARGVLLAMAGTVHGAEGVRKRHSFRLDAFDSGDEGPLAHIEDGALRRFRDWPGGEPLGLSRIGRDVSQWPRVDIVLNHAGADGRIVRALMAVGVDGIVVAGTGNGTVSDDLGRALAEARAAGATVRRSTRCAAGVVIGGCSIGLTPVQLRVELILELLGIS